jgi:hypothetical protein
VPVVGAAVLYDSVVLYTVEYRFAIVPVFNFLMKIVRNLMTASVF